MKRYLPSIRTRSGPSTSALRDQFISELTREAQAVMRQLSQEFTQSLQSQATQALQGLSIDDTSLPLGETTQLLTTGARLLFGQPKVTQTTAETSASQQAAAQFRVSQAQTLAEANQTIARGDKNL